ncbi:E3 ubiquitin-protein ligase AIP2 [Malania oleifera]|uniref:E3 ubiquitin-protein ligase AIP2 n=1 Tax=Malania oleifera TaxID=397392 RepID=UPI0025AE070B|nr:E3 ubiquitin-protein ligase AIP2 [Malania oleifera]
MASSDDALRQQLLDLQKQLSKKQAFEGAVFSIKSLFQERYPSASPSLQNLFFSVISRVGTVLKTRYTAPGFWLAGLKLFEQAERLVSDSSEREHLKSCIAGAREQLHEPENQPGALESTQDRANRGYLFEGHLTVDREPPQPDWLVQSNLLSTAASLFTAESSQGHADDNNISESAANILQELIASYENIVPEILENGGVAPRAPPASKEVVAKLPVITVTDDVQTKLGKEAECAICKENFVEGDSMQELPCKHMFHPPCLKPWLDEHNSCPICRHELQTDDHAYESWKEREKEAEEERKGAANAVRGGEFMYV